MYLKPHLTQNKKCYTVKILFSISWIRIIFPYCTRTCIILLGFVHSAPGKRRTGKGMNQIRISSRPRLRFKGNKKDDKKEKKGNKSEFR